MIRTLEIIVSVIIIVLILLQERGGGLGGVFGGGSGDAGLYQTRRGLSKILFIATIVFIVVFAALALLHLTATA